jgi:hypothetical protein
LLVTNGYSEPLSDGHSASRPTLSESSYWTALDQAELDVIIWELVSRTWEHRKSCHICSGFDPEGHKSCAAFDKAVEAMSEWIFKRKLVSKMEALRKLEEAA